MLHGKTQGRLLRFNFNCTSAADCEIADSSGKSWTPLPGLHASRISFGVSSAVLSGGKLLRQGIRVPGALNSRAHAATGAGSGSYDEEEAQRLAADFARFVNSTQPLKPLEGRFPTALMPPTRVVEVQMDALMRNDWPEDNSGVRTAFAFALPLRAEEFIKGQGRPAVQAARAWDASERYLGPEEFGQVLHQPMYLPMINCSKWEFASPMTFHGKGDSKAVQAVKVTASAAGADGRERSFVYTFCLEKVASGAFHGCWMVVGIRLGDYANV